MFTWKTNRIRITLSTARLYIIKVFFTYKGQVELNLVILLTWIRICIHKILRIRIRIQSMRIHITGYKQACRNESGFLETKILQQQPIKKVALTYIKQVRQGGYIFCMLALGGRGKKDISTREKEERMKQKKENNHRDFFI